MSTARTDGSSGAGRLTLVFGLAFVVGAGALAYGLMGAGDPLMGWVALHVAFLYLLGITFAGCVVAAIYELTNSSWGQNVKRCAEAAIGMIPVVLLGYIGVVLATPHLMEAGHHGHELVGGRAIWLEPTFMFVRDGVALVVISLVAIFFVKHAQRPGLGAAIDAGAPVAGHPLAKWITAGWKGYEVERERSRRIRQILAPMLAFLYAIVLSLFAFDFVMALDPIWISTLFGGYYFISSLYMAWAGLAVAAVLVRRTRGRGGPYAAYATKIVGDDLHSLGKLLFAFCILAADFFWSQFFVIWYANIPEETPFIIRRVRLEPWADAAVAILAVGFIAPFVLLLFKRLKKTDATLMGISLLVLVMMFLERTWLVAPSVWHGDGEHQVVLGTVLVVGLAVLVGLIGLAAFGYRWCLDVFIHAPPERDLDAGEGAGEDPGAAEPEAESEEESEAAESEEDAEDASEEESEAAEPEEEESEAESEEDSEDASEEESEAAESEDGESEEASEVESEGGSEVERTEGGGEAEPEDERKRGEADDE